MLGRLNRRVTRQLVLRRLPPVHGRLLLPVRHVEVVRWLRPMLVNVAMTGHGCCSIGGRRGAGRFGLVRGGELSSGTMLCTRGSATRSWQYGIVRWVYPADQGPQIIDINLDGGEKMRVIPTFEVFRARPDDGRSAADDAAMDE